MSRKDTSRLLNGRAEANLYEVSLTGTRHRWGHDEPVSAGLWPVLKAAAYAVSKPRDIAIVGDPDSADTQVLLNVVHTGYRSFHVMAPRSLDTQTPVVPLLQDRGLVDVQAAAYVCRAFICRAPVTDPVVLQSLLETE